MLRKLKNNNDEHIITNMVMQIVLTIWIVFSFALLNPYLSESLIKELTLSFSFCSLPCNSSIISTSSSFARLSTIDMSGIPLPVSHLDIARSVIYNLSANCF